MSEETTATMPGEANGGTVLRLLGPRAIVLVGLMGAGKTSVGKRIASKLGLPFADADAEIERAAAQTIPEIFAAHGEAYFRDGERRVIRRLLDGNAKVLATGGGAFMSEETRAAIAEGGVSVWLRAELPVLMARVRRRSNRPLLQTDDPEATMQKLMDQRYPVYARADVTVDSREIAHDLVADEVIAGLAAFLERQAGGRAA